MKTPSFLSIFLVFSLCNPCILSQTIGLPTEKDQPDNFNEELCPVPTKPVSCPVNCFRTDPVCGFDGNTYWCGCADAHCSGARVAKMGFCEVGDDRNGNDNVSGQALLLVHIVWLIVLGFSVLFGFF